MSSSLEHLPALLRLTHEVLAKRILAFVAIFMTFGLFCWAMTVGSWLHLAIAVSFALLVFLPILLRKESTE